MRRLSTHLRIGRVQRGHLPQQRLQLHHAHVLRALELRLEGLWVLGKQRTPKNPVSRSVQACPSVC